MIREIFPAIYLVRAPDKTQTPFTYLLRRPNGNILFATKTDLAPFSNEIAALGPIEHALLGDRHHAQAKTAAMAEQLGTVLACSQVEAAALQKRGVKIGGILPYERRLLTADLEVVPTPGHTRGALSYLWTNQRKKYLFVGGTLVPVDGNWKYWVTRPNLSRMIQTVRLLATVDFDVILSNSFAATPHAWIETEAHERKTMFEKLAAELAS